MSMTMRATTLAGAKDLDVLSERGSDRWQEPKAPLDQRGFAEPGHQEAHDEPYLQHRLNDMHRPDFSEAEPGLRAQEPDETAEWARTGQLHGQESFDLRHVSHAAERGAIMGTRRLDKVRAEWRDFTRRLENSTLAMTELRRLRAELRRREMFLFVLGGLLLIMGALYGALVFSSPQLLGNPRSEFGCMMIGGSWAETPNGKQYCIFWAQ
ncbi:hypothetical protein [Rhodoligotrophos ferricapiens]|uniref:hypothetical protein n=1 Tax=Rhodoligotrophos ferricapiens TaxID=3069264 RepID=UPI00315D8621